MNKIFLQLIRAQLLLTLCLLNIYVSAESYEAKEYIGLNNSICKNASKHLTLEDSGFFEYIGGGAEKKFECGNTVEAGNEPCRKDPELICRNINKKHACEDFPRGEDGQSSPWGTPQARTFFSPCRYSKTRGNRRPLPFRRS